MHRRSSFLLNFLTASILTLLINQYVTWLNVNKNKRTSLDVRTYVVKSYFNVLAFCGHLMIRRKRNSSDVVGVHQIRNKRG